MPTIKHCERLGVAICRRYQQLVISSGIGDWFHYHHGLTP
jgi:hypothetical protein